MSRLPVKKTYKLYVGGEFPRSESGRTYEAQGANVARASRKDVRDAVRAARGAFPKWAGMTAYNRGQVLYRIAEMMEARRSEFAELCSGAEGGRPRHRSLRLVRGLGRQAGPDPRLVEPCRRPLLQLHDPRADRSRRRRRAGRTSARRASSPGSPQPSSAGTRLSSWPRKPRPWRLSSWPRCWRPRTSPEAWSTCSRAIATSWRRYLPATWT